MDEILLEQTHDPPMGQRPVEFVERKGLGHPDSICDHVMEAVSVALCRLYRQEAGRVLHHNVDKGLLIAGQTAPRPGGGVVEAPMRIVLGDRAVKVWAGRSLPVDELAVATARTWLREHLRFVDPDRHVTFQPEIRPGSAELQGLFEGAVPTANDTSVGVGFAPLSEVERLVLEAERWLNDPATKQTWPEAGEDVKVMGVRRGRTLELTVAVAFVDRFVTDEATYFGRKADLETELQGHLAARLERLDGVAVRINALDEPGRGVGGMYLTVLGTSAECGDGGEVGRGNRVNGLISLGRPMTLEAAAGKNPTRHVGKIYHLLAHRIAGRVFDSIKPVEEATVWLCSRIGQPLDQPWCSSIRVSLATGVSAEDVADPIRDLVREELAGIGPFVDRLVQGELPVA
ncbi:methionine adenosyltransferase [Tautonia marina]|uniref:methionine adenosyltransferase n=1 Tax=Tautonia marina TaxID=2653855 RepID=UPI001260ED6C|nr:methionine adenosyltransferase [Tautonia marina]